MKTLISVIFFVSLLLSTSAQNNFKNGVWSYKFKGINIDTVYYESIDSIGDGLFIDVPFRLSKYNMYAKVEIIAKKKSYKVIVRPILMVHSGRYFFKKKLSLPGYYRPSELTFREKEIINKTLIKKYKKIKQ